MPLNENAVNEILPFAPDAVLEAGDLIPLTEYQSLPDRLRGFTSGIARRALFNRAFRQTSHIAAGSAQFLANRHTPGIKDDGDIDKVEEAWRDVIESMIAKGQIEPGDDGMVLTSEGGKLVWKKQQESGRYELGEFYEFRHPSLRSGMRACDGAIIQDADKKYPEIWDYLQTDEGQILCLTEAEWQIENNKIWHVNADGSKVGWDGVGGAAYYVLDLAKKTLRLPDMRGQSTSTAGFDGQKVGDSLGDGIREIPGIAPCITPDYARGVSGAFTVGVGVAGQMGAPHGFGTGGSNYHFNFNSSRVAPATNHNRPRQLVVLGCVYLGNPATPKTRAFMGGPLTPVAKLFSNEQNTIEPQKAYQHTSKGFYLGETIAYGDLPNNATFIQPTFKEGFIPKFNGTAWELVENHKGKQGYLDGKAFTMIEYGALPKNFSITPPEPTEDEKALARIDMIKSELKAIDDKKARPVSVVTAWLLLPEAEQNEKSIEDEASMLKELDDEATELREELQILEGTLSLKVA